ncbi:MAG: DUF86 domain-containing protein [Timaviella obliquedivisa GSE-PSE-MK23-08B]|jgi:uncharacterized protein with HEPN domain|nr:DUF86 domain-containing protein [Timaviella obliquedivisa GSE-PSE-MK23-08B]
MSRDQQSIRDMVNAAEEILNFTAGLDYASLESDRRTQAAVFYEILVIGKAANRLSDKFRVEHSTVPWKDIIGMQNILAHQYDKVDAEVVWDVIRQDVPELILLLKQLLSPQNK